MQSKSLICLLIAYVIILVTHFGYYPKWQKQATEATLSWDVSGYYMYLPATFIYKDLKQANFLDDIIKKYKPTPLIQQGFRDKEGNFIMKYSCGQAVQYAPFFFIAHAWASASDQYEADGFSFPYQLLISLSSLLIAFIGLFYLRKILLLYFEEGVVGFSILSLVLGTNYLNYSAIDGAMTHNNLFTLYTLLIYSSISFYKKPNALKAIGIGVIIGLAALSRPTEIIACLIPLLWGINLFNQENRQNRFKLIQQNWPLLLMAVFTCAIIGSLQFIYWKYVGGDWIIYSYENQGFSWLSPHFGKGFFSYRSGWLVYSPIHIFSLIGFYYLYKQQPSIFSACLVFAILFIYIAFAWDVWWYGISFGQRTMVQSYPIMMFAFASFLTHLITLSKSWKLALSGLMILMCIYNLWWTHQAHRGGTLFSDEMTGRYFWKILTSVEKDPNYVKLLDTNNFYEGARKNIRLIYENNLDNISQSNCQQFPVLNQAICLNAAIKDTLSYSFDIKETQFDWVKASADFSIEEREWSKWQMTQMLLTFKHKGKKVKQKMIRIQRHLTPNSTKNVWIDVSKPKAPFDQISLSFWNANGQTEILIDKLKVELFDEETN